ncbi:MAG: D-alanine--D-alanine ligase [Clostridia bacterium]|nr:D-alanine--D-alanine ligase [Clostridia bacterium]
MKIRVGVFFGGMSVEHEVSVISALQAVNNIDKDKYQVIPVYIAKSGEMYTGDMLLDIKNFKGSISALLKKSKQVNMAKGGVVYKKKLIPLDVAFPIVHGTNCEDGSLQGLLEICRIPYVGCDVMASAVGMDKSAFKAVMMSAGLPVIPGVTVATKDYYTEMDATIAKIEELGYPLIVKPANLGSSIGVRKAKDRDSLKEAMEYAFTFSNKLLIEKAVEAIREINCSVLGDEECARPSVLEEPFMSGDILDYEKKYMGGKSGSKGMASLARKIPADVSAEKATEIQDIAVAAFKALGGSGVSRIDFIMDSADSDKVYINEINTIPGSLAFYLWEKSGLKYKELIDELISLAFARQRRRENLTFSIDTNILANSSFGSKGSKGTKM